MAGREPDVPPGGHLLDDRSPPWPRQPPARARRHSWQNLVDTWRGTEALITSSSSSLRANRCDSR